MKGDPTTTFFMFGRYTQDALKDVSAKRTRQTVKAIEKYGGKVQGMHLLLGDYDLVLIVDFLGVQDAMRASIALTRLTGIQNSTETVAERSRFGLCWQWHVWLPELRSWWNDYLSSVSAADVVC